MCCGSSGKSKWENTLKVIGIAGLAGSGKDTVAGFISKNLTVQGMHVKRQGFADKLKVSATLSLGYSPDEPLGTDSHTQECVYFCNNLKHMDIMVKNEFGTRWLTSGRQFLQNYGTEAHRDVFGADFWLDAVLPRQAHVLTPGKRWQGRDDCDVLLIPDVRFDNEAQRVLDYGGTIWEIRRSGGRVEDSHLSEAGLLTPPDYIVENRETLEELRVTVDALVTVWLR